MAQDGSTQLAPAQPSTFEALRDHFPFPTIRPSQERALKTIADARDKGARFTAIEAPTGVGKSGIGIAVGQWAASGKSEDAGAHYLTSQNSLSQQLVQDFGNRGLVQIRGKSNYSCMEHNTNCEEGSMMNGGKTCDSCPYRIAKNAYVFEKLGVTNYTYYLTETMYSGELVPRKYLILDEAHNAEREILAMVEMAVTQHRCDEIQAGRLPRFDPEDDSRIRSWLAKTFRPALEKHISFLDEEMEQVRSKNLTPPVQLQKVLSGERQLLRRVTHYLDESSPDDWLAWSDNEGRLIIKPLTAAEYANQYLFNGSPNVLLMSATILDFRTFARNLGINAADCRTLAVPSEFEAKNRRIVYWPVGSMSMKNIEATLPRAVQRTAKLLDKYHDKKAMIHTHTYRINSYFRDELMKTAHADRITTHAQLGGDREVAIQRHCDAIFPSVLMSPSMTEGLDLKGERARLQIITKIPYPFLDPYNRARMQRDPKWYQLQTALSLVQASGRCTRSEDDYSLTVILDQDFERFLSQNQDILPEWWLKSIEFR